MIGCQNVTKGQEAVCSIQESTNYSNAKCLKLNLADFRSVCKFADSFQAKCKDIYAVIFNAGVWVPMNLNAKTMDGFEMKFGVNHLVHFEFVQLLKDHLLESCIVFVSSSLTKSEQIDFEKQDFVWDGWAPNDDDDSHLLQWTIATQN